MKERTKVGDRLLETHRPARWASWLPDAFVAVWIIGARVAVTVAGFGLAAYLVIRPLVPILGNGVESQPVVWEDLGAWPALVANTLIVTAIASLVSVLIGLPLGFLLFRTDLPGRRFVTTLLLLPASLPVFVSASGILSLVGIRPWDGQAWMVGVIHGWLGIPLAALQWGMAYRHIDGTLEEAAALEVSWRRVCMVFDLRLMLWSFLAVVALQTWLAGTELAVSSLLAVRTFAEEVYVTFQLTQSAGVQSLVVVPYAAAFLLLVAALARAARSTDVSFSRFDDRPPSTIRLGAWRWPMCAAIALILAMLVVWPVVRLGYQVGSLEGFIRWGREMRPEVGNSSMLAAGGGLALLILIMGVGEYALASDRRASWLRISLVLLMAVPTPCLAFALKELMNRPGPLGDLHDSSALPILGQALRWLPLAILAVAPGWAAVTQELRDAARIDGCNFARLHVFVYWPVAARFLGLAAVAMAAQIFGELTASVLLSPPGFLPLSVRFFTLAHYGLQGKASAVCLLVMLVMVIPWAVLVQLLYRGR